MKSLSFVKMHGAGNDFILVDDRDRQFPIDDYMRVAVMAARRTGVGCEGVILVQPSDRADFRMRFFNPDGSEAEMCGNGARCVAAFAREIGAAASDRMRFETAAGDVEAEIIDESLVRIAMPEPRGFDDDFVIAGVPHCIVPVENLSKADVEGEGRRIRLSKRFEPNGTNVDFVVYRQPDRVAMRTYERGVEAETGACGTGAVASAVIGVKDYGLEFPVRAGRGRQLRRRVVHGDNAHRARQEGLRGTPRLGFPRRVLRLAPAGRARSMDFWYNTTQPKVNAMDISKKIDGSRMTMVVAGRVDTTTSPELAAALRLDGITDLTLDISGVSYMSSAGLRCLLMAQKGMIAAGGQMRIAGAQPVVKEVLDITGFSDIFTLV